ncbi:MAG: hypothetical protein FWC47_01800 [Oscillospiraceae bacterium]|nr:hypothetical protein [Oscillospiraceae bacterium]
MNQNELTKKFYYHVKELIKVSKKLDREKILKYSNINHKKSEDGDIEAEYKAIIQDACLVISKMNDGNTK